MNLRRTPVYRYYKGKANENINVFNEFIKQEIDIFYAIKSNNYEPLVKSFINAGYGFDIASIEELQYLVSLGVDPRRMSFSAPTKLARDIKRASQLGVQYYAFDSRVELEKILKCAKKPKLIARITAQNEDAAFNLSVKFGMDKEYYSEILKLAEKKKWPIVGVTFHVGSQNTSITSWRKALDGAQDFIDEANKHKISISVLNIGGGIPAQYSSGIKTASYYIGKICEYIRIFRKKNPEIEKVIIEPGRALSANTMDFFVSVVNLKDFKTPPLVVTDASIFNGIIEPLEHFEYDVEVVDNHRSRESMKYYKLAGISCDGYDIIKRRCLLPKDLKVGDRLVIKNAGAYTFVYENFHMRKFPNIIKK